MKSIIYIPARSGSKRIKNKNIKYFNKKPLLYWTIDFALKFKDIKILISTDNLKWIRRIEKDYSNKLKNIIINRRPKSLSMDKSNIIDAINYDLKKLKIKNKNIKIMLLQPTSPFRNFQLIKKIHTKFIDKKNISIASFKPNKNSKNIFIQNKNEILKKAFYLTANGNFYICSLNLLRKFKSFINKNTFVHISKNEYENIDIDYKEEWKVAENFLKNKNLPLHLHKSFSRDI